MLLTMVTNDDNLLTEFETTLLFQAFKAGMPQCLTQDLEEADLVLIPWTGHLLTQEEVGLVGILVEVMVLGGKMVLKVVEVQSGETAMLVVTLVTM